MPVNSRDKMTLFMSEALIKKLKYKALETDGSVSSVARHFLSSWEQNLLGLTELGNFKALPESSAIYFVIDGDSVYYVGKAKNLRQRFLNHHKFDEFQSLANPQILWVAVSKGFLHDAEKLCMDTLTPNGNSYSAVEYRGEEAIVEGSGKFIISFVATTEQKAQLETWAKEDDRTVSATIRQILEREFQNRTQAPL